MIILYSELSFKPREKSFSPALFADVESENSTKTGHRGWNRCKMQRDFSHSLALLFLKQCFGWMDPSFPLHSNELYTWFWTGLKLKICPWSKIWYPKKCPNYKHLLFQHTPFHAHTICWIMVPNALMGLKCVAFTFLWFLDIRCHQIF